LQAAQKLVELLLVQAYLQGQVTLLYYSCFEQCCGSHTVKFGAFPEHPFLEDTFWGVGERPLGCSVDLRQLYSCHSGSQTTKVFLVLFQCYKYCELLPMNKGKVMPVTTVWSNMEYTA